MKVFARLCLSAIAVLLSSHGGYAQSQTHTLSGLVYGGSQPLPGVLVEALEYNGTRVIASSTSNADGRYSMGLVSNTYDLRVTPPAGSGYQTDMIRNFAISGEDRVYDILLLSSQPGSLSGTIRGRGLQPVPNATIYVNIGPFSEATTTDASGHYTISTINGPAFLQVFGTGPTGVAPQEWYVERYDVFINGPTVFNLDLPVSQVNGLVRYADTTPASGATVEIFGGSTNSSSRTYSIGSATADINGLYSMLLLNGSVRAVATSPSGPQLTEVFSVAGNTAHDFTFPSPVVVTGTIRGRSGLVVPGVTVFVSVGTTVATAVTDDLGRYSLEAEAGPAYLQLWGDGPTGVAPASFYLERYDVTINSGPTVVDINLPVVRISGAVKDTANAGVIGALVALSTTDILTTGRSTSYSSIVTGDGGVYEGLLLIGDGMATVTPPSGSTLSSQSRTFRAAADSVEDFTLPPTTLITGTVRARGGVPVPNATVTVTVGSEQSSGETNSAGQYSLSVPAGSALVAVAGGGSAGAPTTFLYQRDGVSINGPTTFDVTLPVAQLTGLVTDANGVPIPEIPFTAGTSDGTGDTQTSSSSNGVGGIDASLSTLLLPGTGSVLLLPAIETGFIPTEVDLSLSGDASQTFAVQHGAVAPIITAGPVIFHLSDTSVSIGWTTNRESTSIVEYGVGGSLTDTAGDSALTTDHLVTLTGLTPATLYDFRVGSDDAVGTGATFSTPSQLATLAAPADGGMPIITDGPTVVFADDTSVIIEWTTDEPSSSIVEFGTPRTPVDGEPGLFRVVHRVRITGLTPNTAYPANLRTADPNGNETISGDFTFSTTASPDTTAPLITVGPTVVAKDHSKIVVAWTTNEPSTSGVSFNDGTAYDLTTDPALTRTHRITLAGLAAGTMYHIRVSSTDAAGNGPTLSGVLDVTTNATPDLVPPVISNVQVSDVSATRAVISWLTDEPANAILVFGEVAGAPDNFQGDLDLSASHSLAPNVLKPSTTYYLFAVSTDVAGNTSISNQVTFTTEALTVDQPPTAPNPVSVPPSPTRNATIHISWGASTDDHGVTGYEVRRDGAAIGTTAPGVTSFDDTTAGEGTHVYEIGALDFAGHITLSDPATVVIDRTAPTLSLPGDLLADAVGTTATVTFTVTASDNFDPAPTVTCSPVSGTAFSVGTTPVSCTATDTAGNSSTGGFNVIVRDVTPPIVTVPPADITLEATSPAGAVATFTATAFDVVDGPLTPVCTPESGSTFHIGLTQVMCIATDAAGNEGTAAFNVVVVDSTAPVITQFAPSLATLSPPDHRMVNLTINLMVHDTGDSAPVCSIIAIRSNEPINGTGDGDTGPDWSFSGLSFSLRAERAGSGSGRIYTIDGQCTDSSGNVSHATTTVRVPKKTS